MRLGRLADGAPGETVFVFLVMPMRDERTYNEYREHRLAVLHAYVQTARLKAVNGKTFVGIAFDNPNKNYRGGSEDLFVLSKDTWTAAELAELERKRQELGLWKEDRMEWWRYRQDEFPQASQAVPLVRLAKAHAQSGKDAQQGASRKADKQRQKMQQMSKRRNRKKK